MNKRAIAILGAIFILIVGTLGVLIYLRSNKSETPKEPTVVETQPDIPTNLEPTEPEPAASRAVRLTDDPVVSPILFYQGNGISYFNRQGQLFQTDIQSTDAVVLLSNKRELSIALKPDISRILWPRVGNSFIAEFQNGSNKKTWSVYDSSKGVYVDLPQQVSSVDWVPTGDKIMFIWVDANNKATLNISNPDTSGYQTLTDLYEPDNVISVSPDGKNVLFHRVQNQDQSKNPINLVSSDGKTFRGILSEGYNKGLKWAPNSSRFLFTKRDSSTGKFVVWMADISSGEIKNLGLTTDVSKVVWSKDSQTIYAAVPQKGTAGEGLTEDTVFRLNVGTLERQEFAPGVAVDVQEIFLSSTEETIFFRNAQDQSLYYISVK